MLGERVAAEPQHEPRRVLAGRELHDDEHADEDEPVKAIMPVAVAVRRSRAVSTFAVPPSRRPSTCGATIPRRIAPAT